jgi:hypothetical protein
MDFLEVFIGSFPTPKTKATAHSEVAAFESHHVRVQELQAGEGAPGPNESLKTQSSSPQPVIINTIINTKHLYLSYGQLVTLQRAYIDYDT